jgi:hypothetical protein
MTSYTWNGVTGYWRTASDWSPVGGPPRAADAATIDGSATTTIKVRKADFANSLTLSDPNATLNDVGSSASLTISGALAMSGGTLTVSHGALRVGALNLSGGLLNVKSNGRLHLTGTLSQTGGKLHLEPFGTISGGTIDSTGGRLSLDGGRLSGVTFDGPMNLTAKDASVHLADGTTVVGGSGSGPGTINDTGQTSHLYLEGTQTVSNTTINLGNAFSYSELSQDVLARNAVLTLGSSVTVEVAGSARIVTGDFSGDEIVNQGSIDVTGSGGGVSVFGRAFANEGTIDIANGGPFYFGGTVTGKGTDTISGGSKLEFEEGVSNAATLGEQDIAFTGAGALSLLQPANFYGEISGFAANDTVELLGSWAFSGISPAGGVTTLTLARGSTTHAFEFGGDYAQSDFSITPGKTTTIGFA